MRFAPLAIALALAASPLPGFAQTSSHVFDRPTLAVSGDAVVERSPDIARVAVTLVTSDDDAARSAGKNTDLYNAFKAKVAALGIATGAVRTTFFNVQFIPHPPAGLPPEQRQPRYGYVTSRSLSVDVAPIEKAGKVVDAATAAGVTDVGDVSFELRDRKAAYREALAAALVDAKANATALAAAGALHLLKIQTVSTEAYAPIRPVAGLMRATASGPAAPSPTEIQPNGPISISAHVNVVYVIQ